MIQFDNGNLILQLPGEILSMIINRHIVRKERVVADGVAFYRFTVDPGMRGEWTTMFSEDEKTLMEAVQRRTLKFPVKLHSV